LAKDYEKDFGAELKASATRLRMSVPMVAKAIGINERTVSRRYQNPGKMDLEELKRFIKATGITKETVINYLYEGK
jgi:hypothetical protein